MSDFLLEILSEEIPAKAQLGAAQNFSLIAIEILSKAGIALKNEQVKSFVAPRRIALYISDIAEKQVGAAVKKIGPKVDADKKAVEGFLRANQLSDVSQLEKTEHNGALCFLAQKPAFEIDSSEILQNNLPAILQKMIASWPKTMRFDTAKKGEQAKWIRPVRNVLCIFGNKVIDVEFAGLKSNNLTCGHFLASCEPLKINDPRDYKDILRNNFVIVDQEERKEKMLSQIKKIESEFELQAIDEIEKSPLYDEVNGLCEFPTALVGEIDKKFMSLPKEVLILTLKLNQKYFCLNDKHHHLSPKFIFISNALAAPKDSEKIIADNEKIVRARLADAQFFIDEDLKTPLAQRESQLKNIVFHQKLGSVYDRLERIENVAELLCLWIAHCDISLVERTAHLCKADLVTKAVAELPELQGKMGSFYAKAQGENQKIATAIYEHYLPLGPNSELPKTPLGIALAIADKIDIITGLFLANEKPTSSKDPFALRRMALGVIRMSFTYNIHLPLRVVIDKSLKLYKPKLVEKLLQEQSNTKLALSEEIIKFFFDRLKNFLRDHANVRKDVLNAVIDGYSSTLENAKYCDLLILAKKAVFLNELVQSADNIGLIKVYKRSFNVLAIEEKKDNKKYEGNPSALGFKDPHEKALKKTISKITPEFKKLAAKGDFKGAFKLLRLLENPLTKFFDHVVVNDKNKKTRANRLLLLSQIRALFSEVADLSQIELS